MKDEKASEAHPSSFILHPFLTIEQASAKYPVFVGRGLLDQVGALVQPRGAVFIITSEALRDRFGERVAETFRTVDIICMPEGESHKTLETASDIVTELLNHGAKRDAMA